jgi:hypothetical protein
MVRPAENNLPKLRSRGRLDLVSGATATVTSS